MRVSERMYRMAVDGYSVSEIAVEYNYSKSSVRSKIKYHCIRNDLDNPLKKGDEKPNGLFCLACNRPLVGRQRKWCGHLDCGGWSVVHPPTWDYQGRVLRNPMDLSVSQIDELLADYNRREEAEVYIVNSKKARPKVERSTETMTFMGRNDEPISMDFVSTTTYDGHYNPNNCETCKTITDYDQYGYCDTCGKKNPTAITVCKCKNCGYYTLNDASGICLKCDKRNPRYILGDSAPREVIKKRTAQYEEWTGKKNWQYYGMTYWSLAKQKLYEMVIDGQSVSDIAQVFNIKENTVKAKVREYCRENGLDSPWKRR